MALMRTSRMTVKTTTLPAKKSDKYAGYNELEKEFLKGGVNDNYVAGGGKFSKNQVKMNPSQLEEFNKEYIARGGKLKYKEVRYDPNDEINKDGIKRFQGNFAHPIKDKGFYKNPVKIHTVTSIKTPEKVEVGKLPTRKLNQSTPSLKLITPNKKTEMVPKQIQGPKGPGRQFKNTPSVTNRLKPAGTKGGGAEGRKYRKEEKLAGAYVRTKSLADENQGPRVFAGAYSKEKKEGYKAMRSDLKAARKETGVKIGSAMKDTRKAQKFEKKEQVGKIKYFTKSNMAETVKKTPSSKGKWQAGKMRYS